MYVYFFFKYVRLHVYLKRGTHSLKSMSCDVPLCLPADNVLFASQWAVFYTPLLTLHYVAVLIYILCVSLLLCSFIPMDTNVTCSKVFLLLFLLTGKKNFVFLTVLCVCNVRGLFACNVWSTIMLFVEQR